MNIPLKINAIIFQITECYVGFWTIIALYVKAGARAFVLTSEHKSKKE